MSTDSKARLLQDIREILKQHGATMTPTTYLFERKGRILFQPSLTASNEKLLEYAIEVGALDVDVEEDGTIVLLTEPKMISTIAEAMSSGLGLKTESTEFIWDPKQDAIVNVGSSEIASMLTKFTSMCFPITLYTLYLPLHNLIGQLEDDASILGIYLNTA